MKRLADQTLYEILDVREDAPAPEIEVACDRAREIYGPGSLATYALMAPDEAELLARRIDEARATLLDTGARARYDEALRGPREAAAAAGASTGAPFASLPPVIPAAQPAAAPARAATSDEPPPGSLPIVLAPALVPAEEEDDEEDEDAGAEPPPPAMAAPGAPRPIPLEREILTPLPVAPALGPVQAAVPPPIPSADSLHPPPAPVAAEAPQKPPPVPLAPEAAQKPPPPRAAAPAPAPAAHPPIPAVADGAWTGDALRQMREARGLTVPQIAERTRVTRHHIDNIEAERFGALPAPVYLRGILLSLARELRLDGQKVARAYLERSAAALAAAKK